MEIKTEADSNDVTECTHDDQPSTSMLYVGLLTLYRLHFRLACKTTVPCDVSLKCSA